MSSPKCYLYCFIFVIISKNASSCPTTQYNDTKTVRLVQVVFRHGDRTNDVMTTYPNDPHINETYEPYGYGQLTNKGKRREYMIGEKLRKRFDTFLGKLCRIKDIEAISTDMPRTKMSLLLVLAGLCPPQGTALEWNTGLNWLPFPYDYTPFEKDEILTLSLMYCPNYIKHYYDYANSPAGITIEQKYADLYEYLTKYTGKQINSTFGAFAIYFCFSAELEYGLALPDWTIPVFPQYLEELAIDQYRMMSATSELKRLSGGFLLRKIIGNIRSYIDRKWTYKVSLYSGHEMNIAYLLNALEVYFPHVPPYGAYITVELHERSGAYCVEIHYQDYSRFDPRLMKIPGCQQCCPFKQFVGLLTKNLPKEGDTCGDKSTLSMYTEKHRPLRGLYSRQT